jgi:hypothetical protein
MERADFNVSGRVTQHLIATSPAVSLRVHRAAREPRARLHIDSISRSLHPREQGREHRAQDREQGKEQGRDLVETQGAAATQIKSDRTTRPLPLDLLRCRCLSYRRSHRCFPVPGLRAGVLGCLSFLNSTHFLFVSPFLIPPHVYLCVTSVVVGSDRGGERRKHTDDSPR